MIGTFSNDTPYVACDVCGDWDDGSGEGTFSSVSELREWLHWQGWRTVRVSNSPLTKWFLCPDCADSH